MKQNDQQVRGDEGVQEDPPVLTVLDIVREQAARLDVAITRMEQERPRFEGIGTSGAHECGLVAMRVIDVKETLSATNDVLSSYHWFESRAVEAEATRLAEQCTRMSAQASTVVDMLHAYAKVSLSLTPGALRRRKAVREGLGELVGEVREALEAIHRLLTDEARARDAQVRAMIDFLLTQGFQDITASIKSSLEKQGRSFTDLCVLYFEGPIYCRDREELLRLVSPQEDVFTLALAGRRLAVVKVVGEINPFCAELQVRKVYAMWICGLTTGDLTGGRVEPFTLYKNGARYRRRIFPDLRVGARVALPRARAGEYEGTTGTIASSVSFDPCDQVPVCLVHTRSVGPTQVFAVSDLRRFNPQLQGVEVQV